jgi:anti-sigma B factor antagonist
MKYSVEKQGNVVLIAIQSSLEGGPDTMQIRYEVKEHLAKEERRFLIDMSGAGFVNSTGIGVVVSIMSSIKTAGGALKLCGVSDRARRAFVTTGVWQLFDACASREEALGSF